MKYTAATVVFLSVLVLSNQASARCTESNNDWECAGTTYCCRMFTVDSENWSGGACETAGTQGDCEGTGGRITWDAYGDCIHGCSAKKNSGVKTQAKPAISSEEKIRTALTWHSYTNDGSTTVEKTPTAGRGNSASARLDACFVHGHGEVDDMEADSACNSVSGCESVCYTYCDNGDLNNGCSGTTGADSCYTRCDDKFGGSK